MIRRFFGHVIGVVMVGLFLTGCATNADLQRMKATLEGQIAASEERQAKHVSQEISALRKEIEQSTGWIGSLRKADADTKADLGEVRDQLRRLRGSVESLQKELNAVQGRLPELKEKLDQVAIRINFLENFLGIGKTEGGRSAAGGGAKGKSDKENLTPSLMNTSAWDVTKKRGRDSRITSKPIHSQNMRPMPNFGLPSVTLTKRTTNRPCSSMRK